MKSNISKIVLSTVIGLSLCSPALAQSANRGKPGDKNPFKVSSIFNFGALFKPPGRSQPRYTMGGGVRGKACNSASESQDNYIQALVPQRDGALASYDSEQVSFAVRTRGLHGKIASLIVTDDQQYLYEEDLVIGQDGITVVNFNQIDELKPGDYTWSIRVICGEEFDVNDPSVISSLIVSNVPSSKAKEVQNRISEDAKDSLWYNALSTAIEDYSVNNDSDYLSGLLQAIESDTPKESVYLVPN